MNKKLTALLLSGAMTVSMIAGYAAPVLASEEDQAAADAVAAMIDAIYVQERTEETDAQCAAAKEAWDALTDAQKELVEGESADPDYFGRDTGDAAADNPRNSDEIGEKELLVVSFGTSFNDSRAQDIGGIEAALEAAYPDWAVRRAFTAQIIINHVQARDGEYIDNIDQALQRAVNNGVKNLVVQPTHLMQGAEYDELCAAVEACVGNFESVQIAKPLLGDVGEDATVINADKETVAKAVVAQAVADAGYPGIEEAAADGVAFVLMGHGTAHQAAVTYDQMQAQMEALGYTNVYIGTVEGEPEDTECSAVIEKIKNDGYSTVVLRPLMVVAGDHANNDMAGDEEDSWKSMFEASGAFENVACQISGLGRIADVQAVYVAHAKAAIDAIGAGAAAETDAVEEVQTEAPAVDAAAAQAAADAAAAQAAADAAAQQAAADAAAQQAAADAAAQQAAADAAAQQAAADAAAAQAAADAAAQQAAADAAAQQAAAEAPTVIGQTDTPSCADGTHGVTETVWSDGSVTYTEY